MVGELQICRCIDALGVLICSISWICEYTSFVPRPPFGFDLVVMGSRQHIQDIQSGPPLPYADDIRAYKKEYAEALDAQDPLRSFRDEFIIPSKKDLKRSTLAADEGAYQSFFYTQAVILTLSI
jgi:hypothetical protein